MEKIKNWRYLLPATVLLVCIINVLQSSLTELLPDEAYYWIYSQQMDLGYFDHPPFVAVWIWISDQLFTGELGVRFFSAISFSAIIYFVWKTIDHPKKKEYTWLYLLVILSAALLNVYGFITTPDTPLVLFAAIFFYAYKEYLKSRSSLSYVLLSVSIAGMMYSKYQGILIVFFVLVSNWKLIKDYKLWLMALGAFILFIPHLYWQFENDFASIRYHLFERVSNRRYKVEQTIMHVVNMIAIIGLTFPIVYAAYFKNLRTKDAFKRSLNFIVAGFFLFFLFSSFRGRTQAQWVVPISIPLILITFDYIVVNRRSRKWFVGLAFASITIMFGARVLMLSESLSPVQLNTHGNEEWALSLQKKTEGQKKIFVNSYQNTATYWYYTKEKAYYMKNFTGRNNHFTLMQQNEDLSADKVVMVSRIRLDHTDYGVHVRGKDSIFISEVLNYTDFSQLRIIPDNENIIFKPNEEIVIPVTIEHVGKSIFRNDSLDVRVGFLKHKYMEIIEIPAKFTIEYHSVHAGNKGTIVINHDNYPDPELYRQFALGLKQAEKVDLTRLSNFQQYSLEK